MSFLPSIVKLPKDTTHSCVFDWPDRPVRPTPPVGPPPLYPYDPADDWDPNNPLDNGIPPTPPPTTIVGIDVLYWSIPNIGYPFNIGNDIFKEDAVTLWPATQLSTDSTIYVDPNFGGGGGPNVSSIGMGLKANGDFHGFFNFRIMKARYPSAAGFTTGVKANSSYLGGSTFNITLKDNRGVIPPASITELGGGGGGVHDFGFSGFTLQNTYLFPRPIPTFATAFFSVSYNVATSTLTISYP